MVKSRPESRRPLMELVIPDPLPGGLEERSRRGGHQHELERAHRQCAEEDGNEADEADDASCPRVGDGAGGNPREFKEGEVPVAAALLACFPQIFPSASFAKRACRKGGSLQAFHPKGPAAAAAAAEEGKGVGEEGQCEEEERCGGGGVAAAATAADGNTEEATAKLRVGKAVACVDRVRAGDRLLLVVYKGEPPEGFIDAYGRAGGRYWEESQKEGAGGGGKRMTPNASWDGVLEIVEEDEDYAVIVKPPALPSHSCAGVGSDVKTALMKALGCEPGG